MTMTMTMTTTERQARDITSSTAPPRQTSTVAQLA